MSTREPIECNFTPAPIMIIETTEQIKAFTDPLRIRILGILRARRATNQQIADTLGEAHSKVLYHIRYLLDVGLVKLIDTQIKGGNVEKYYRAVAHLFDIRPASYDVERDVALLKPALDRLRTEMLASVMLFPAFDSYVHTRMTHISEQKLEEFNDRLCALLAEYWPIPEDEPEDVEKTRLAVFVYRDPGDLTHE